MKWISVDDKLQPKDGQTVVCKCPDWCEEGYQIAKWDGRIFRYESQPNLMFNNYVKKWAEFEEVEDGE